MKVEYFGELPGGSGNILWRTKHPMRGGRFPIDHPCFGNPEPTVSSDSHVLPPEPSDDPLGRFRARGYWASCFPEGDGLCFKATRGQEPEQALEDARACFVGWDFKVRRL